MTIGYIASLRGRKFYDEYYQKSIKHLKAKGHEVKHFLHMDYETVHAMPLQERDEFFDEFYRDLLLSDVILADCSFASMNVGYRISHLLSLGKQVLVMCEKGSAGEKFDLLQRKQYEEHVYMFTYSKYDITETIDNALSVVESHVDKRFTMIFPASLMSKLEHHSTKKKLPKAVFIRKLLEESLAQEIC